MDFLLLEFTPVLVMSADWTPVRIGYESRMYLGNLMVYDPGKKWEGTLVTPPLPESEAAAAKEAIERGIQPASGAVITRLGVDFMTVHCVIEGVQDIQDGLDFREQIAFKVREV